MPANIVFINSPEQRFYPKFWCFSPSAVWNDDSIAQKKDLCNGLSWAPTGEKHGNTELWARSWTLFLSKASPAGRLSVTRHYFSFICSTMTHTFFFMLSEVVALCSLKMMLSPELRACRTSKSMEVSTMLGGVPSLLVWCPCAYLWPSLLAVFQAQLAETLLYNLFWKEN